MLIGRTDLGILIQFNSRVIESGMSLLTGICKNKVIQLSFCDSSITKPNSADMRSAHEAFDDLSQEVCAIVELKV